MCRLIGPNQRNKCQPETKQMEELEKKFVYVHNIFFHVLQGYLLTVPEQITHAKGLKPDNESSLIEPGNITMLNLTCIYGIELEDS